jgi:glycyl-tRNA synthetase (class II)
MLIKWHCDWLLKCPVCGKCRNVADHLYKRCQKCVFSHNKCTHTEEQIASMIKRQNFKCNFGDEGEKLLGELIRENRTGRKI